jgi:hypothetical protein
MAAFTFDCWLLWEGAMRGTLWDEVREMVWLASVIGILSVLAVSLAVALAGA